MFGKEKKPPPPPLFTVDMETFAEMETRFKALTDGLFFAAEEVQKASKEASKVLDNLNRAIERSQMERRRR